MVTTGLQMV